MKRRILKNFNAFSLAEVMIALVIVAILMAASAPLVNRKASLDSNFQCYWSNTTKGIYFNNEGTGQVGIGVQPSGDTNAALHLKANNDNHQIALYDTASDAINIIDIYNNNIILGSTENVSNTGNLVIGYAATDFAANGNTLVIGSRDTTLTPILYGKFNSDLKSQILKVNGQLQVGQNTSLDNSNTTYSLIVDEKGIYSIGTSYGCIVAGGMFKIVDNEKKLIAEISSSGIWLDNLGIEISSSSGNSYGISKTGQVEASSIISNGNITASSGTITGNSIVSNGDIKASGTITGNTIDVTTIKIPNGKISVDGTNICFYPNMSKSVYFTNEGLVANIIDIPVNVGLNAIGPNLKATLDSLISSHISDIRLKNVVGGTKYGLDEVRKMEIVEYKFKDEKKYGKGLRYGVIAQEIQKILPNVVEENKDGFLAIRPNDIFFVAINAIKELDKELQYIKHLLNIDELKLDCSKLSAFKIVAKLNKLYDENVELKNEIKLLKEQNQSLEKRLEIIEKQLQSDK